MNLNELQEKSEVWTKKNFPNKSELTSGLVAAEEASEAAAAITRFFAKTEQNIRQDESLEYNIKIEMADAIIAFSTFCTSKGWSLSDIVEERSSEIFKRVWA